MLAFALYEQPVTRLQAGLPRGKPNDAPATFNGNNDQSQRCDAALRQGPPGQHRSRLQGDGKHELAKAVECPQVALASGSGEFTGLMGRQQPAAEQHHEQHPAKQRGRAYRQKIEKSEAVVPLFGQGRAHQQVGRRADLGGEPAQQAAE